MRRVVIVWLTPCPRNRNASTPAIASAAAKVTCSGPPGPIPMTRMVIGVVTKRIQDSPCLQAVTARISSRGRSRRAKIPGAPNFLGVERFRMLGQRGVDNRFRRGLGGDPGDSSLCAVAAATVAYSSAYGEFSPMWTLRRPPIPVAMVPRLEADHPDPVRRHLTAGGQRECLEVPPWPPNTWSGTRRETREHRPP